MDLKNQHINLFKVFLLVLFVIISHCAFAQSNKKQLDREAILSMAGCYDVGFKYTETFAPEIDYEKAYDYTSAAFEWAEIIENSDDKIGIQHLLIINDSTIIKHWRQDWVYESTDHYRYDKNNHWKYETFTSDEVEGKWTQNVFQVDDSPRYSGTATWVHVDGKSSWENKADSPLPRREYTTRKDYNVMKRGNHVQILDNGWLHEQDNDKIIRSDDGKDVLLVQEKGYNDYKKRADEDCQAAIDWWKANEDQWSIVRDKWDEVFNKNQDILLEISVDNKKLYEQLFYSPVTRNKQEISDLIDQYIITSDE